jgi:hypothetical protein
MVLRLSAGVEQQVVSHKAASSHVIIKVYCSTRHVVEDVGLHDSAASESGKVAGGLLLIQANAAAQVA